MTQSVKANVVRINPSTSAGSRAVTVHLALDPTPGLRHGLYPRAPRNWGRNRRWPCPLTSVRAPTNQRPMCSSIQRRRRPRKRYAGFAQ